VGVADARMAALMAGVFAARGTDALVFRGEDGLDELAPTARSRVWEVRDGVVTEHLLDSAAELDLPPAEIADLRGADAAYNADVARRVLAGERGPVRDAVLLNAAAALVADASVSTATGTLVERLAAAMALAGRAVDDGRAADVLERWRAASA
jgi:anthranilate phosphoribosyltransferase